jgi:branched-chain amino acid transport system substrate-binding protein
MNRKLWWIAAAAVAVSACAPSREPQKATLASDIPVGVYAALSGSEAAFGTATVAGVRQAADEINAAGGVLGRKIRLIVQDDQGRPDEAVSVVTKFITADRVAVIIGENSSNQSLAAAPIAQAAKIPMISPSSTNPAVTQKGDYIFRVCFTDPYQGAALASFVTTKLGLKKAAILRDNKNDYSVGLAEVFESELTKRGGQVVITQSYTGGDSDFHAQLTAIHQAAPEVVFIPGFYTEVGQIAIQARDLGITVPLVGGDGWDSPTVIEIGGRSLDGCYYSDHYFVGEDRPAVKAFVAAVLKRLGKLPDANSALGYDALRLYAQAVKAAGTADPARVRDALASTRNYQGVSGVITMGPERNPLKPVAMIKIENLKTSFAGWVNP